MIGVLAVLVFGFGNVLPEALVYSITATVPLWGDIASLEDSNVSCGVGRVTYMYM